MSADDHNRLPALEATLPVDQDIRDNKDIAALSYLWIVSVILFFWKRNSPFVRFHSKQGMILFGLTIVLPIIPVIGKLLVLVPLAGMVMGFMNAAQGLRKDVPVVGQLSRGEITIRQAWQQILAFMVRMLHAIQSAVYDRSGPVKDNPPKSGPPPTIHL